MFHFIKSDQHPSAKKLAALYFYFIRVSSYKIVSRSYTTPLHHLSEQNMLLPYEISKRAYLCNCPYLPCLYEKACVNNMLGSRATIRNVNLAISYPAGRTSNIVDNVPTQIDFPFFKK